MWTILQFVAIEFYCLGVKDKRTELGTYLTFIMTYKMIYIYIYIYIH